MRCPHCDRPLAYIQCPECGSETPEKGAYCCQCGKILKKEEREIETAERTPCSDGTCVGTINEKGICNICGKPYAKV